MMRPASSIVRLTELALTRAPIVKVASPNEKIRLKPNRSTWLENGRSVTTTVSPYALTIHTEVDASTPRACEMVGNATLIMEASSTQVASVRIWASAAQYRLGTGKP